MAGRHDSFGQRPAWRLADEPHRCAGNPRSDRRQCVEQQPDVLPRVGAAADEDDRRRLQARRPRLVGSRHEVVDVDGDRQPVDVAASGGGGDAVTARRRDREDEAGAPDDVALEPQQKRDIGGEGYASRERQLVSPRRPFALEPRCQPAGVRPAASRCGGAVRSTCRHHPQRAGGPDRRQQPVRTEQLACSVEFADRGRIGGPVERRTAL